MRRIFCVLLTLIMLFSLSGCTEFVDYIDNKMFDNARVGFSDVELTEDSEETVFKISEFSGRNSQFSAYGSSFHYNLLDDTEKTLYHIFEYALENGYTNILVDDAFIDNDDTFEKVLTYLSLDSPLVEQNFRWETGTFTKNYPTKIFGIFETTGTYEGIYITVDSFTLETFKKKQLAVEKAKNVVNELPQDISVAEKAERLYRYVAEGIEYYEYCLTDDAAFCEHVHDYLYDAAITGKTHCDGYANYLSLLMNIAGIECIEKLHEGMSDDTGHTWNMFCIDGKWYNCDATGDSLIPSVDSRMSAGYYFAFPDERQKYSPDYAEIYPVSDESLYMPIDAYLTNEEINLFYTKAWEAFSKHDDWALILLDEYDEQELKPHLQRLANKLGRTISHFSIDLHDGRVAVLVCDEKYYD